MRHLLTCLAASAILAPPVRAQTSPAPAPNPGQLLTHDQMRDWGYYDFAGWKDLSRNNLASAEQMFGRAIEIARIEAEADPRLMARSYADLAWVLHRQGRDAEAEPLARWALAVREAKLGAESMSVAQTNYTLAAIEVNLGKLDDAERLLERTLTICEGAVGTDNLGSADAIDDLASVLMLRRKYDKARALYGRSLAIFRRTGRGHPGQYTPLDGLATIDLAEGKLAEAEARLAEALEILEGDPYADPTFHAGVLRRKADLLRKAGRPAEAARAEDHARAIAARVRPVESVNKSMSVDTPRNGWLGSTRRQVARPPSTGAGAGVTSAGPPP